MNKNLTFNLIFTQAVENQRKNNLLEAKKLYNSLINIDPNHFNSLHNLGLIYSKLSEFQKAIDCLKKAIEVNPSSLISHLSMAKVLFVTRKFNDSKKSYEKALEIDPNNVSAYVNLGVIALNFGEYEKAKVYCEKVLIIDPNNCNAFNNLGVISGRLNEHEKSCEYYKKILLIEPDNLDANKNFANFHVSELKDFNKAISTSCHSLKVQLDTTSFKDQTVSLFRLKHDVEQAKYLSSKNYEINGIDQFQKVGDEILSRKENKEIEKNSSKTILLTPDEINSLLPFFKSDHIYQTKKISGSCINPNKNWLEVEDEYFNSSNQIIYIDDFLSEEALIELREFCLASKVWTRDYLNKYLGAFSENGFISPVHLQIAIELKQKLPKLFGPHRLEKFWGFKYDSSMGKGINIHADFAFHNLNFWITPDEYNNNKNSGGLKVYDTPAPDNWLFMDYNNNNDKIYTFLKDNNSNCTNVPYKFNRAVLFNSAYFHETDEIDFKDVYEGRRINNTYLFGNRVVK